MTPARLILAGGSLLLAADQLVVQPPWCCNARCLICVIWMKRQDALTPEAWDYVCQNWALAPFWFTVIRGAPFMNRNIVERCQPLDTHCRPGMLTIPANSLKHMFVCRKAGALQDLSRLSSEHQSVTR